MAIAFKPLFRGNAATTNTTLYTVPAATTTVINNILVTNSSSASRTYTLNFNGIQVAVLTSVPANDTLSIDIKQVLTAGQTITGLASATDVRFHISGLEIT